ncbi:MAG TPA: phage tail domain-containing protein, partial [Massilibacterium sp.]|nr:phage tail domain-containing protein [Massilibacterium sp.]
MRRLTFTNNRGESIEFYLSPFLIESLEGIGEVEAELQEQVAPYRDGSIHIDAILRPRFIELEGSITNIKLKEIRKKRQELSRVCNPKLGLGKITLELDGSIKEIHGVTEGSVVFPERERNPFQPFMITWKCPDPYWKDLQEVSRDLKAYEGKFTFPFQFPVQF